MARGPRPDAPGVAHHVMVRGIERRVIFADDADREAFLDRFDRLIGELEFRCFAWALMPNHVHLVVRTGPVPLARLMARLGTGYAVYFNSRHGRAGHLFQNRYRSRLIQSDRDLMGVVLYVHRNPLEAQLVPDARGLECFPWCGHGALTGARRARAFEACSETLELFADDAGLAVVRVREWMKGEIGVQEPLVAAWPAPPNVQSDASLDEIVTRICKEFAISPSAIGSSRRSKGVARVRAEIVRTAVLEGGFSGRQVARCLGVAESTVSRAIDRLAAGP